MTALSGFTLFKVPKGWQMSTREQGQDGWSIRIVTDEQATACLLVIGPMIASARAAAPALSRGSLDLFGRPARRSRVHL